MLNLGLDNLRNSEKKTHELLIRTITNNKQIRIIDAAELCGVSPSTISKLVKKMGFENFKQYKLYFSGQQTISKKNNSSEVDRLVKFLESYDPKTADDFISVFSGFKKAIIFGLGPSYISCEYFAYKLAPLTNQNIFVTDQEDYAKQLADEETLFIVFSVTGKFTSFENLFESIKKNGAKVMFILEEYINTSNSVADYVFYLSNYEQSKSLLPFEKTRTVFFIFIEEIIYKLKKNLNCNNK